MLRKSAGLLTLAILFAGLVAAQDKSKEITKKPAAKEVPVTVSKVDAVKGVLTVATDDGRVLTLPVTDATRFVGPLGGVSGAGIKDDRLKTGAAVTLLLDPTGKKLIEVRLPTRAAAPGTRVEATITRVNVDKMILTVTSKDGKKADVPVSEETKFLGPLGGVSPLGIKDDRVKVGAEVTLVIDKSGNKLLEVNLPRRDSEPAKDKPKEKDAPKPKDKPAEKPKEKK